jgi:hypothetical protein
MSSRVTMPSVLSMLSTLSAEPDASLALRATVF